MSDRGDDSEREEDSEGEVESERGADSDGGRSDGGQSDGGQSDGGHSDGGQSNGGQSNGGQSNRGESDRGEEQEEEDNFGCGTDSSMSDGGRDRIEDWREGVTGGAECKSGLAYVFINIYNFGLREEFSQELMTSGFETRDTQLTCLQRDLLPRPRRMNATSLKAT